PPPPAPPRPPPPRPSPTGSPPRPPGPAAPPCSRTPPNRRKRLRFTTQRESPVKVLELSRRLGLSRVHSQSHHSTILAGASYAPVRARATHPGRDRAAAARRGPEVRPSGGLVVPGSPRPAAQARRGRVHPRPGGRRLLDLLRERRHRRGRVRHHARLRVPVRADHAPAGHGGAPGQRGRAPGRRAAPARPPPPGPRPARGARR